MFSIGRFARLSGVSAKTLRAYDAFGLFRPAWIDPSSGYRYYSPAQLPDLRRILALRDMGLGLVRIRELRAGGDLRAALERRRAELEHERREIERRLRTLDIRVDMAEGSGDDGDVVVRPVAAEAVAVRTVRAGEDDGDAFYELEAYVRDLGRRAHRPPGALVTRGRSGDVERVEIFVPVTRPVPPRDGISYRRLPAVRAATVLQRGPYDRLPAAWRGLERWAERTGLTVADPVRILYLQFGAEPELGVPSGYLVERPSKYLTELQLPVG